MKALTLLLLMTSSAAWSSSYVTEHENAGAESLSVAPHCEVTSRYSGHLIRNERYVYWMFDAATPTAIGGANCAELTHAFQIFVPGAKPSSVSAGGVAYPEHIRVPVKGGTYRFKTAKRTFTDPRTRVKFSEWIVIDWRGGFKKVGN